MLSEKNSLINEVAELKRQIQEKNTKSDEDNISKMRELQRENEILKEENSKRVSDTKQYQQMRQLMQSQSSKIRDMR